MPSAYQFQLTVHARGSDVSASAVCQLGGREVRALRVPPASLAEPMGVSFEQAELRLGKLPRMYVEPDCSFVWVSSSEEDPRWQVDGNLYDRADRLMFVDLNGTCPPPAFDDLLRCFGWPETPLIFQLTRQALFLDEAEFRRFAARPSATAHELPLPQTKSLPPTSLSRAYSAQV